MDNLVEKSTELGLERQIIKEVGFTRLMTNELVDVWGEGIPEPNEAEVPEWTPTKAKPVDLRGEGYGQVWVKDESDPESNPTGTIKDRPAWELATLYREFARTLYMGIRTGEYRVYDGVVHEKKYLSRKWESVVVPIISVITSGNEGRALARCFEQYKLPPPKLILGADTDKTIVDALKELRTDLYMVDLSRVDLKPEDILRYTNNTANGIDLTSNTTFEPQAIFYDWHVHEAFGEEPDMVFLPFGSGRLMENYLYWIMRTVENAKKGVRDPRLTVEPNAIGKIQVLGTEPEQLDSIADKLPAKFKPFLIFKDTSIDAAVKMKKVAEGTGKYRISEERIKEAHALLLANGFQAEPSAAAGLALYLEHFRLGLIDQGKKILVINTGRGLDAAHNTNS